MTVDADSIRAERELYVRRHRALHQLDADLEPYREQNEAKVAAEADSFENRMNAMLGPGIGTLSFLFGTLPEVGAWVPYSELPPESVAMLKAGAEDCVSAGMLEDDGKVWTLTDYGARALKLYHLVENGDPKTFADEAMPLVFPEGRALPTREEIAKRSDDIADRAIEVQDRLGQAKAYEILCSGRKQAPW